MQGKGGVDTVPPSTEVGQLARVDWEAGWEESEVQEGRTLQGRALPQLAAAAPHQGAAVAWGCGSQWDLLGVAQPAPSHPPRYRQCPTDTQKSKKRVCIPSSKAQLGLQIQMYGQNVNAL